MASSQLTAAPSVPARRAEPQEPLAGTLDLESLPGRPLSEPELRRLTATLASRREAWTHLVAFDSQDRVYASLYRDAHVDVWLLCWTPDNDTGWHDHDISSGAVAVVSGELVENNLSVQGGALETRVHGGEVFSFGPDHIHRLNGAEAGSVSVHAYSPPLWRMGQYAVGDGGVLRRLSVSYADELRPID